MSTLAEIEAAIESLPTAEQRELLAFLARRVGAENQLPSQGDDPFARLIGAYAGAREATGRNAEELLYGSGA